MNVSHTVLMKIGRSAALVGCAAVGGLLGGCAVQAPFGATLVVQTSPIAAEVASKAEANQNFPQFTDIPPAPADLRPAKAWGAAAADSEVARDQLMTQTADETWTLSETDRFAESAALEAGPAVAEGASTTAATEAFAAEMRRRATPPPSPR
jgi:hypothetical protein